MSNRINHERAATLDLQQLRAFQMVAVTGNFTRAAAALGYSQSTVTYQVKTLESKLGFALLDRTRFSRHTVLTDAGRRVLAYAEGILDLTHRLLSKDGIESGS